MSRIQISRQAMAILSLISGNAMGGFSTDVYCKLTDAHQYLNFRSCHPPHVRRGFHVDKAYQLKNICCRDEVLKKRQGDQKSF